MTPRKAKTRRKTKGRLRRTPESQARANTILLERGACTARESAQRHGVSRYVVQSIWHGRRWHVPFDRQRTLVLIRPLQGRWHPATTKDEAILEKITGSRPAGTQLATLVARATAQGVTVVFRGDVSTVPAP